MPEYDPELDPTPEDGEYTPRDELILMVNELKVLQAEDFNLWRAARIANMEKLITEGVEGDAFVFEPSPPQADPPSEFDSDGFSEALSNGCVAYEPIIEIANRWAGSNDRLLEFAASELLALRSMLPIARLEGDSEFQDRYAKNLATAAKGPWVFGRSGYKNQPVFESFAVEEGRSGQKVVTGQGVVENHFFPYAGANQVNIVQIFKDDVAKGAFRGRALRSASNAVFEMDRDNRPKWEGYRAAPLALRFQRNLELDLAKANPDY